MPFWRADKQRIDREIGDRHHLDIRRGVGGDAVAGERKVARGEHAALRILDVDVLDIRQVADIAGHGDVALVLDRARLRAIAHAQIALPLVGHERHEQKMHALVDQMAGEFGKLAS